MKPPLRFITEEEAITRFDINKYDLIGTVPFHEIVVLEGDTVFEENLTNDSITTLIFEGKRTTTQELIIINGNLTIKGNLSIGTEICPTFLILGDLHCDSLYSTDEFIEVTGDAYIKYIFDGNYNHGAIRIAGTTHVPYVLNSDHSSNIKPSDDTIIINYHNSYDDFFDYDYYSDDLVSVCVPEVLGVEQEELDEMDEDEKEEVEFDRIMFAQIVKSGESPFRDGAKTKKELLVDRINKMGEQGKTDDDTTTLDLTEQKLTTLPLGLFDIHNLETLILQKNNFVAIPTEIGKLVNLKELNLRETKIDHLPDNIGDLKSLEVLNLAYCSQLQSLPESIGDLVNLKKLSLSMFTGQVPDSVSKLARLEELVILYVHLLDEQGNIIGLPDWVFKFRGIKKLHYKINDLTEKDLDKLLDLNPDIDIIY